MPKEAGDFAVGPLNNPLGADIGFLRHRSVRIPGPWQLRPADEEKTRRPKEAEEFAVAPRHNNLAADIGFVHTVRSGYRPLGD